MNERKVREAVCRQHLDRNVAAGPVGASGSRGVSWARPVLCTVSLESYWPEVNCFFELAADKTTCLLLKAKG